MLWHTVGDGWDGGTSALKTESQSNTENSISGTTGIFYKVIVRNSSNAGNLQLQWAQSVADASNNKLLKHSYLTFREIGAT